MTKPVTGHKLPADVACAVQVLDTTIELMRQELFQYRLSIGRLETLLKVMDTKITSTPCPAWFTRVTDGEHGEEVYSDLDHPVEDAAMEMVRMRQKIATYKSIHDEIQRLAHMLLLATAEGGKT